MKWILFTGTWRLTSDSVENDVRAAAKEVLLRGDGILTGGATGVDYFAMHQALQVDPSATHLRVIIPARLDDYEKDYYANWLQDPITATDIKNLIMLLQKIKAINPSALLEMPYAVITQEHYDLRSSQEVMYADELYAFHVNASTGTQFTINKARESGVPTTLHKTYTI